MAGMTPTLLPIAVPAVAAPYACGIAFAVIALGRWRAGIVMLRAIAVATALTGCVVGFVVPALGILELMLAMLFLAVIGVHEPSERRVAAAATAVGAVATIWFGFLTASPSALPGVVVGLAGSIGLAVGGVRWLLEGARRIPTAIARPR
jgi:hypothetical protein